MAPIKHGVTLGSMVLNCFPKLIGVPKWLGVFHQTNHRTYAGWPENRYSYLCQSSCLVWWSFSPWDVAISPASYLTLLKQRHRICRVWPGLLMWFQAEGCQAVRACASSENWYETTQVESCVIFNTRSEVIFKMLFSWGSLWFIYGLFMVYFYNQRRPYSELGVLGPRFWRSIDPS